MWYLSYAQGGGRLIWDTTNGHVYVGGNWKITRATRLRVREVQLGRYMALGDVTVGVALRGHMSSRRELGMESKITAIVGWPEGNLN